MAPRHAAAADRRRRVRLTVAGCVVLVVAAAAVTFALLPTTIDAPSAGAAMHGPLQVRTITPTGTVVSPDAPLRVVFNNPLAATSPMPTIAPAVAGSWARLSANEVSFRAAAPHDAGHLLRASPCPRRRATPTARPCTPRSRAASPSPWARRCGSTRCSPSSGYLPVRFVPTGPFHPTSTAVQRGTFTWRWADVPPGLTVAVAAERVHRHHEGRPHGVRERPQPHRPTAWRHRSVWDALLRGRRRGTSSTRPPTTTST